MTETTDADELYQACKKGDIDTVKKFFNDKSREIDVGARYEVNRSTLLHAAAGSCNVELLEFLFKNGFATVVNETDVNEYTALHIAVINGDPNVCKILLQAGTDVALVNQKGNTAFHEACKQNNSEICNLMLDAARTKGLLGVANKDGKTPLHIAAERNKPSICTLLQDNECEVDAQDQVRAMSRYKHSNVEPKLSHRGLIMVCQNVQGMIQLTKDMRAIYFAVRTEDGNEELANHQLSVMKEMALYELNERSIGTQWNLTLYLSPVNLKGSEDLEKNVYSYTEDALQASMQTTDGFLLHPKRQRKESVAAITGWQDKDANVFKTDVESLMELAEKIPDNEKEALGHYLGINIKSTKIYQIQNDIDGSRNQTFQIPLHWRHKQGANPSAEGLKKALVKLVSESAERLNDDRLRSIVQTLDRRQWQNLAVKLNCSADEVHEKEQTAQVFINGRRQQARNIDVIKYFAEGLRGIGRQNAAQAVETTLASTYVPETRPNSTQAISSSRDQGDDSTDSQEGATSASTDEPQTRPNSTQAISSSRDQVDDSTDSQEGGALTLNDLQWGEPKLGGGAHGEVYPVTFKGRYLSGFKGHTNAATKRVDEGDYATNEIGSLKKLAHPNIVKLLDVIGPIKDSNPPFKCMYYIVMERGDMNLFEYMDDRNKPLTTELKFKWALSITDAVKHLHNNRIVHRDLKPHNCIIFTETLKLCDFGISRDASSTMTTKGGRGTYFYLAPETDPDNPTNKGRKKTFSNKSDVYQVGCILWELLARESLPMPPYLELSFLGAHAQIETILRMCLDTNPRNRPDISTLHSHLRSIADATSV